MPSVTHAVVATAAAAIVSMIALHGVALLQARTGVEQRSCASLTGRFLSREERTWWLARRCDHAAAPADHEVHSVVRRRALGERAPDDRVARRDGKDDNNNGAGDAAEQPPVVAVGVATTTRGLVQPPAAAAAAATMWWRSNGNSRGAPAPGPVLPTGDALTIDALPLARLLTSLTATAEPGFRYRVYVVYDEGDAFYDVRGEDQRRGVARDGSLVAWFDSHVALPLAARGISARLVLVRFNNRLQQPAPAMNVAMHAAYDDGADFLYRVNDDTEFLTPWASAFVAALQSASPPLLGVVGPYCGQGNTAILTHDFTHRTHLDIFSTYYPRQLTSWYVDDWITRVYGGMNTRRARVLDGVEVLHREDPSKRRYVVSPFTRRQLDKLVLSGVDQILEFIQQQTTERPDDPTLEPDLAVLVTEHHRPQYPYGVYDADGNELVPPMPSVPPSRNSGSPKAHHRVLRPIAAANADDTDASAAASLSWADALEEFYVVRRLAKVRRSLCAVSGC